MKFRSQSVMLNVTNHILNLWDEIERSRPAIQQPTMPAATPAPPDPAPQGALLDQALAQPMEGAASPEGAAVAAGGAMGESPLDSLLGAAGAEL